MALSFLYKKVKKIFKLFLVFCLASFLLLILLAPYLRPYLQPDEPEVLTLPIGTLTYLKKSEQYPYGANKYEFQSGIFIIPERLKGVGYDRLRHDRFFAEIKLRLPQFSGGEAYSKSDRISEARILMEVTREGTGVPFKNFYRANIKPEEKTDLGEGAYDYIYPSFEGYRLAGHRFHRDYEYIGEDIITPMNTPLVIRCSDTIPKGSKGRFDDGVPHHKNCRYNLIFDSQFRLQVRFYEPMLAHFPEYHHELMAKVNSVWTPK